MYRMLKANCPAVHKLGNISRPHDDLIVVQKEEGDEFIGNFSEGFGFIDVRFKKTDCRLLTKKEAEEFNSGCIFVNNTPYGRLDIPDEDVEREKSE